MPSDRRVQCPVVDEGVPTVQANAFRIYSEVGDTFFLDFLHLGEETSQVVARLRIQREAMQAIRDRLAVDVREFQPARVVH